MSFFFSSTLSTPRTWSDLSVDNQFHASASLSKLCPSLDLALHFAWMTPYPDHCSADG